MSRIVGSILHGAYGDYYEQAACLKHYALSNPETRIKLFAADPHRLEALRVLDFSWADCFELYTEIPKHQIDKFLQFQIKDRELRDEVLAKLPDDILSRMDSEKNLLPWRSLRSILPLSSEQQLSLSDYGRNLLPDNMRENGISPEVFRKPTIGFLWRYRASGGAISAKFQPDAARLVEKYSRLFRRLSETCDCRILVCGMKVERTSENMHRINAKYPPYGLDLPAGSSTHLKGLSWPLELEILSRCTVCVANPSGFSEALWIKRGSGVVLMDPPADYVAKALWHRAPFFNLDHLRGVMSVAAMRSEELAYSIIVAELNRSVGKAGSHSYSTWENAAS